MEVITAYGGNFLIPGESDCIGNILKQSGQFETDDIRRASTYLDQSRESPGGRRLFVDIGANIGTHSISALKEHGYEKLLAIEPSADNYRLLTANLCLNGIMDRALCIQAAASENDGMATLFHNPDNCGDHRLNIIPQHADVHNVRAHEQVKTINICTYLTRQFSEIPLEDMLCWIDTQGHELAILRSLQPLLEQGLPVVMEFWPFGMEQQQGSFAQLASILSNPRLKIANISSEVIQPMGLDELELFWRRLRAADKENPEGASYSNLLIHASGEQESIHPEEAQRISMTVSCKDSESMLKVPGAGEVFHQEDISYQLMHNGLKVIQGGYYGTWMCELIRQLHGHHEPQEEKVFDEISKRASDDGLMIEIGCYWAYYSLWFVKDHPSRMAIGLEPDANHLVIAKKNAQLNNLDHQFRVIHGVSSSNSNEALAIRTESGGELMLPGYTLQDLLSIAQMPMVEIAHCDAQGAESHVVDQIIELGKNHRLRFCVISTHAYEITGDPLTHQTCLQKLQTAGAHIIAEHDVHESFSGDGLIAASFSPKDQHLKIPISCNRYSTSLFPNPAFHLSHALQELSAIKKGKVTEDIHHEKPPSSGRRLAKLLARILPR
jgi:FkbM family methyltransferase